MFSTTASSIDVYPADEALPSASIYAISEFAMLVLIAVAGAITAGASVAYFQPSCFIRLLKRYSSPTVLWNVATKDPVCSLTIDDAPTPSTPAILDVLKKHDVKATFFLISGQIPGNEHVVRRMLDEGHALGNHLTEDSASIKDSLHAFEEKLVKCDAVISNFYAKASDQVTRKTKWMRPASGWFTNAMKTVIKKHGYRICLGSVYPHDAQIHSERINSWYLRNRTTPGSVIIVHDRPWTINVLENALPAIPFNFLFLDELEEYVKKH